MKRDVRLIVVEDSETDAKLLQHALRAAGWVPQIQRVETEDELRGALASSSVDAVISDWSLPRFSGAAALALVNESGLDVPFIIVSGTVGEEAAVEAMRAGARDYVIKGRLARLAPVLERELSEAARRLAQRESQKALERAEEQLRQAQKLEAIGGLAAGIAHDFNNLLSVILGSCDLLLTDLDEKAPVRESVADIHSAGVRAAQLTQQLLAFARRQMLQPRHVALDEIVAGVVSLLRRLLGENIDIVVKTTPGLGKTFLDAGQLEQVLINLAVNARDAMPNGGKLIIETANIVFDDADAAAHPGVSPGPHVVLAVSDTGVGMDAETRARIFEPFFTTKGKGKGTGLGLSMVFGIVQQSGGTVWVYSEVGRGTTFKLYFPRSERGAADPAPLEPPREADLRGSETVLVVEDDRGVRKVVHSILRRYGYTVLEVDDVAAAIDLAAHHPAPIDLVITDVIMPTMNGRELSQKLHEKRPALRVLFMSGYTDDSIVHHGVLDPNVDFIQKPITPDALLRKLRTVLDRPGPHGPGAR